MAKMGQTTWAGSGAWLAVGVILAAPWLLRCAPEVEQGDGVGGGGACDPAGKTYSVSATILSTEGNPNLCELPPTMHSFPLDAPSREAMYGEPYLYEPCCHSVTLFERECRVTFQAYCDWLTDCGLGDWTTLFTLELAWDSEGNSATGSYVFDGADFNDSCTLQSWIDYTPHE